MKTLRQSPLDPAFVQNPYATYARVLAEDPVQFWDDYGMMAVFDATTVQALLRDRRLGRAVPEDHRSKAPDHLAHFDAVERVSMLDLEPPHHTRLRGLVLRAFTSRRIKALEPDIHAICDDLLARLPDGPFDLIPAFCTALPVRVIARLLGVPEEMSDQLLRWSNAMVAMYQAGRTHETELAADAAAAAFTAFLTGYVEERRHQPRDDLITHLIAAEEHGEKLSHAELIGTCILLLNAGHEATVHTLGNAVKALLEHETPAAALASSAIAATVEEVLRFDPPLHMFTRYAYEDIDVGGRRLAKGQQVALILGAAGRDPARFDTPDRFDPTRPPAPHAAFGGGLHFCVGAPLARLELQIGLQRLFQHAPGLTLTDRPRYADSYHFHGLTHLSVTRGAL
ncbi:cytochrome P450 [Roseobacter sinensis]|uniref:Cytochrome P450 n=1 Tax=Roseobacter sinensis TaxID=2931391 RepID=A0ABT3BBZ0_9RHOB|nr:cytochrome P450 [Roseobacter sp. WL0113]MCV3271077.1 cytochrome P450 [Roseobacter sp. WL0113]